MQVHPPQPTFHVEHLMPKVLTMHVLDEHEVGYPVHDRRVCVLMFDRITLYTIERPWLPNPDAPDGIGGGTPKLSAIPMGEYDLVLRDSPSKGEQWHMVNHDLHVFLEKHEREHDWQRFSCMFHVANYVRNVIGCIGPGESLYDFGGSDGLGVSRSGPALLRIKDHLDGETTAKLRIV